MARNLYDVGDKVILHDGSDNDPDNVGWVSNDPDDDMDELVGTILTIRRVRTSYGYAEYKVDGSDWWYSEVWLEQYSECKFSDKNNELDALFGDV